MQIQKETIRFYDSIAEKSFHDWFNNSMLLPVLRQFLSHLPKEPKILDLGCGTGGESKRLSELGATVIGIDASEKSLEFAKNNVRNAIFRKMDIRKMDFPGSSFNGILEAGVLFHFTEREVKPILRNIKSILKPDGVFLSVYPAGDFEGFQEINVGSQTFKRFARNVSKELWIETVLKQGFKNFKMISFSLKTNDIEWIPVEFYL